MGPLLNNLKKILILEIRLRLCFLEISIWQNNVANLEFEDK